MESTPPQRWARCPAHLAWKSPGLPRDWVRVLAEHPRGVKAEPGYCWLDMPGKVLHVGEHELEFREGPYASEPDPCMLTGSHLFSGRPLSRTS
jgi:hypothetical protein